MLFFSFIQRDLDWVKVNQIESKELFFPKLRVKDDKEITSGFEFGPDNGKDFFWISNGKATYQEKPSIPESKTTSQNTNGCSQ